ncbi:hypothetical protein MLD38_021101 [Melastoma candidum]|uniref:Uncharacterized protein n=1 Tax=Melastoma candidum TaxID=119954 RepID=A0ACB9QGW6_9MYRT|nr:hypothetical protein MLD38_021101 [Melastoma candidum]
MASTGRSTAIYVRVILALILVLLLMACVSGRESNVEPEGVSNPSQTPLKCSSPYGVQSGDTCFDIAKQAGLDTAQFLAINPNLVCEKLFVGQWVCIKA